MSMNGNIEHFPNSIEQFHARLNRKGVVPDTIYRRNHVAYALVCYVNNIVGCLASENHNVVALFLTRAAKELIRLRIADLARPSEESAYFEIVEQYLRAVTEFVLERGILPELAAEIPSWLRPKDREN
jgi:hypothetical protein